MGKFLALSALLSVVATGFAQTYTVQNNCPGAIDLHVGNLPAESLASGATTVKTGLGPLAEFYTTTNGGIVDGRFVGAKAGFHLIPNFWAYYVGRDELDWFNTGITIIPNVPEHDGFCKVANCADAVNNGCTNGYPTLDQWSTPPGPDDGPIGAPIFQCKDANVDFTITFCPSGQWPNRPSQVIKPVADQSKCLDVRGAVFENGTPVQIYDCNGTAAQKWVIQDESSAPSKRIRLSGTNFCLDAGDNPAAPTGSKLKIWTCYSSLEQQRFNYIAAESRISITQPFKFAPSFCMDVTDGRFENANQVQMWDCANDNANQKWVAQ